MGPSSMAEPAFRFSSRDKGEEASVYPEVYPSPGH